MVGNKKSPGVLNADRLGVSTVESTTNCGIARSFFGGRPDVLVVSQMSQFREDCSGFCNSLCDLLLTTSARCDQAPETLQAIDYL